MHVSSTLRHALAVTHPSLPNYLALTAGTTFGIEDDSGPSAHRLGGASIFSQVRDHHCPLALADAWLGRFVTSVVASRAYDGGRLVVFVTWDEGSGSNQVVPLLVVARSVPHRTVALGRYGNYSLLRTTEALLGLPPLRNAAHAASMVPAFHL